MHYIITICTKSCLLSRPGYLGNCICRTVEMFRGVCSRNDKRLQLLDVATPLLTNDLVTSLHFGNTSKYFVHTPNPPVHSPALTWHYVWLMQTLPCIRDRSGQPRTIAGCSRNKMNVVRLRVKQSIWTIEIIFYYQTLLILKLHITYICILRLAWFCLHQN